MSNIPAFVTALRGKFAIFAKQRHCLPSDLEGLCCPMGMAVSLTGASIYGEIDWIPPLEAWNYTVANG